jgi:hypothetical protein
LVFPLVFGIQSFKPCFDNAELSLKITFGLLELPGSADCIIQLSGLDLKLRNLLRVLSVSRKEISILLLVDLQVFGDCFVFSKRNCNSQLLIELFELEGSISLPFFELVDSLHTGDLHLTHF